MSSSGQDVNGNPVVIKESNITGELSRGLEVKASSILPAKDNYRQTAAFPLRLCFRPPHSSSLADSQPSPPPTGPGIAQKRKIRIYMPIYQTSAPVSPIEAYMYIDPLSGSTMFREFIGTVPQGQSILRLSERVRTCSDKRERTPQP